MTCPGSIHHPALATSVSAPSAARSCRFLPLNCACGAQSPLDSECNERTQKRHNLQHQPLRRVLIVLDSPPANLPNHSRPQAGAQADSSEAKGSPCSDKRRAAFFKVPIEYPFECRMSGKSGDE